MVGMQVCNVIFLLADRRLQLVTQAWQLQVRIVCNNDILLLLLCRISSNLLELSRYHGTAIYGTQSPNARYFVIIILYTLYIYPITRFNHYTSVQSYALTDDDIISNHSDTYGVVSIYKIILPHRVILSPLFL